MQGQEFLCSPLVLEADLASFLLPCRSMGLFNQVVAARRADDLDVLNAVEHEKFPNGRSIAPQLVSVDHVWHAVMYQQPSEKGLRRLGIPPILQKEIQHCARVIDGALEPEVLATDLDADLIQKPPGTPPGFPVTQLFSDERREFDVPLAKRVVADLNTTFLKQVLHISVTERKAMVEPNRVLDDADRETVAAGTTVSHEPPPYRLTCQNRLT